LSQFSMLFSLDHRSYFVLLSLPCMSHVEEVSNPLSCHLPPIFLFLMHEFFVSRVNPAIMV
jgi:hypothetical protein